MSIPNSYMKFQVTSYLSLDIRKYKESMERYYFTIIYQIENDFYTFIITTVTDIYIIKATLQLPGIII